MRSPLLALALGAVTLGCQTQPNIEADVVLTAVMPLTGKWEDKGKLHENAVRMALQDLIAGGIEDAYGGRFQALEVNSGDGKDVVEQAVRDIVEGPDGEKILGLVSSTGDAHEGSARVAADIGIPAFEGSNGAADGEFMDPAQYTPDQLKYLLSSRALCNYEAVYTAQFIQEQYPTARVALIRGDETHDKMHTEVIRNTLLANGFAGTVIDSADPALAGEASPANRQDFLVGYDALESGGIEAELRSIIDTHQPDLIFFHVRGDGPNLRVLQDTQRAGFDGAIATCGMARTATLIDPNENGLISDYLVGEDGSLPTSRFHFVMRGAIPSARLDAFKAEYKNRYGLDADTFTPSVYDATMLWGLGVLAASAPDRDAVLQGIIDSSQDGVVVSRDNLKQMIELVRTGENVDYDGVYSAVDVRDDRTVPGYYYIERVTRSGGTYIYEKLSDPAPVIF